MTAEMMNTHEVAAYLRIKERKVYDLVRAGKIPCTRVTGKWLFPRALIDRWVADHTAAGARTGERGNAAPAVVAGSHDPLLDWALRESRCGLAALPGGSLDGLDRLVAGEAALCGLHVFDAETGAYNEPLVRRTVRGHEVVLLEWAWRSQGLVVAPGNPLGLQAIEDLRAKRPRVVPRQRGAGSQLLLVHLLSEAGVRLDDVDLQAQPARSESDLALAVVEGKADVGLAIEAVAPAFSPRFRAAGARALRSAGAPHRLFRAAVPGPVRVRPLAGRCAGARRSLPAMTSAIWGRWFGTRPRPGRLDNLAGPVQHRRRQRDAHQLGGLDIDHQVCCPGRLHGEPGRILAAENPQHQPGRPACRPRRGHSRSSPGRRARRDPSCRRRSPGRPWRRR